MPVWRGFFGERARTAVYGWSEAAFRLPYMRRKVLGYTVHIPLDPELVQHVLLDNVAAYAKPDIVKGLLAPVIGRGLLTSDGKVWREQRRIVAASFTPPAVDALVPVFASAAQTAMRAWSDGKIIDLASQATATTMRVISDSLFAGDPRLISEESMAHIAAALDAFSEARIQALLGLPVIPLSAKGRAGRRGQTFLRNTLGDLVRERRDGSSDDFLSKLIRALGERFDPDVAHALAVDNAATFYLAGHETTANAITWTLFLLAEQPELQERAAAEVREALAASEADTQIADQLPLLQMVIEESLRLYPPVPRFDRQAVAQDWLGNEEVAPGDIVSIWPWLIHRHKALWDNPDAFDQERFTTTAKSGRHRFQYLPFGAGQRVCVGARFATVEALTILANWLREWSFKPLPSRSVRMSGMVTLRPAGGLPLILQQRS
ncbi:MAG: cytochrome P450 [Acidobacteria bacterium]|nr:cytochrome P450 [Acidobacteriota bacterium]